MLHQNLDFLTEPNNSKYSANSGDCPPPLTVCGATSGAHINPCLTIAFVVFRGFPKLRAVRYIIAQILGGFIACSLIYAQYKVTIDDATAILVKAGTFESLQFTPSGPAGAFAVYLPPGQSLGRAFLNEFITDTFIEIVVWAALDPSNILVPPPFAPVSESLHWYSKSYRSKSPKKALCKTISTSATANWDFSEPGLAVNTARDLGARFMAMAVWGMKAAGGRYSAVAALTNIPATLVGVGIYEFFLTDCERVLPQASLEHEHILANYGRNCKKTTDDIPDLEKQLEMDIHSPVADVLPVAYAKD